MKLKINEDVNLASPLEYDNIEILGYMCTLAANDLHHIHLCAMGDKFQEIHSDAESYMNRVRDLGDICFELIREENCDPVNETFALDTLNNLDIDWKVETEIAYYFTEAYEAMSRILSALCDEIIVVQKLPNITSDISSELDNYLREFTKDVNYFIDKKIKYRSE